MFTNIPWSFSSAIQQNELAKSFVDPDGFLSADQMSHILNRDQFQLLCEDPDAVERVSAYLDREFFLSPTTKRNLLGFLSAPGIDRNDYFIHCFISPEWTSPASDGNRDVLHRYVTLLILIIDSAPWPNEGWPFGRYSISDFDLNYSNKIFDGLQIPLASEEPTLIDHFRERRFIDDLTEFGQLLANFSDSIDDNLWSTWLTIVEQLRRSLNSRSLDKRLDRGVDLALTRYFYVRGIERTTPAPSEDRVEAVWSGDYREYLPRRSPFWVCLEGSISRSIPRWAESCSDITRRFTGLIFAAANHDPFARRFVRLSGPERDCIEVDFEPWEHALGCSAHSVDRAFVEAQDAIGIARAEGHTISLYFNT